MGQSGLSGRRAGSDRAVRKRSGSSGPSASDVQQPAVIDRGKQMGRTRHAASVVILLVGTYVLVLPFALSLFSRTRDADTLDHYYRPLMSAQGIDHFRSNLHIVDAGGAELNAVVLPQLKQTLGMNDSQFDTS